MGNSILDLVLRVLRDGGFRADVAYPGQKHPVISESVAAVHILKTDGAQRTVTAEVFIVCKASLGGTRCETDAVEAAQLLSDAGAECVLEGCEYDGINQTYSVRILATFREETVVPTLDFQICEGTTLLPHAVRFCAERVADNEVHYSMGQSAPAGISEGQWIWNITLEELVPPGEPEVVCMEAKKLTVTTETGTESYTGCCWKSIKREFTRDGLRQIRVGTALTKEVG